MKSLVCRFTVCLAVLLALAALPLAAQEEQAVEKAKEVAVEKAKDMAMEKAGEMAPGAEQPAAEMPEMTEEMKAMMEAWAKAGAPGEPHSGLAEMAGTWNFTIKSWMDPAGDPMHSEGTAERTMILGGRVMQEQVTSDMMGQKFEGIGLTGYDNVGGKYWSAWMDSMSTGCYVMHGKKDESGTLVFKGEMEDPMRGTMSVKSTSRMEGDDKQIFEWYEKRGEDWVRTMEIVYTRAAG